MEKKCIWSETGSKNGENYSFAQYFIHSDGGRSEYFDGKNAGDCVTRSIAIATGIDYKEIYDLLAEGMKKLKGKKSARNGVNKKVYHQFLLENGFDWIPTMKIGQGCKVHLRGDELPKGVLIARLSRHLCCVIDGVIYDNHDSSRCGSRCVYGYYKLKK